MAFMKFNRFTECESGATILTEWLELPHLEQQLIKLRLNTGAMFTELFSRTMVGQTKLPRKYRYTKRIRAKHKQMEADMKESGENTAKTVIPNNEFSEQFTGDMPSMDKSIHYMLNPDICDFPECAERELKHWKTMSNNNGKL